MNMNNHAINIARLRLQTLCFSPKAGEDDPEEYDRLFRDLSPVPCIFWSEPMSAPSLPLHIDFNDLRYNDRRRARREIVKGRFHGGNVGYIEQRDMELFAALYNKPMDSFTPLQLDILDILRREGPMSVGMLKTMTGKKVKDVSPALQRLQLAYLVFEDQTDSGYDRAFYPMETEFPDFDPGRISKADAMDTVILRLASRMISVTRQMIRDYFSFNIRDIDDSLQRLTAKDELTFTDGAWFYPQHLQRLLFEDLPEDKTAYVLHRSDPIVRAFAADLKKTYSRQGTKILQYILIDGRFAGAVYGSFRFTENEIDDIVLDSPQAEAFKDSIIAGVYAANSFDSPIAKFNGKPFTD
jgi:hypothetical protein